LARKPPLARLWTTLGTGDLGAPVNSGNAAPADEAR
jgi:hypothetical protein